jgi:hypothetical protein
MTTTNDLGFLITHAYDDTGVCECQIISTESISQSIHKHTNRNPCRLIGSKSTKSISVYICDNALQLYPCINYTGHMFLEFLGIPINQIYMQDGSLLHGPILIFGSDILGSDRSLTPEQIKSLSQLFYICRNPLTTKSIKQIDLLVASVLVEDGGK